MGEATVEAHRGPELGEAPEVRRGRRILRMLLAVGAIMLVLGLAWSAFFAWREAWAAAAVELALAVLGLSLIATTRCGRTRMASWLAFTGLFLFVCVFALVLDAPTAAVPRTTHLFLLVEAACVHYLLRGEKPWLRYGAMAVLLSAFVWFAATPAGVPHRHAIADGIRSTAIWVNLVTVALSLLVVLRLAESDIDEHRILHRGLRDALSNRRFELFYQPQVDAGGRVVGAEALLRWRDPARGLVAPAGFIQAAEETGFILPLGQWALAAACQRLRAWQDSPSLRHLRLSVNVSALQLRQPDFVEQVLDALARSGADARQLTLELTESMLLRDVEDAAAKMRALHAAGVRLSLDDFGMGYSSLSYLRQMPFGELKIDRAFTAEIARDAHAATITRNMLQLGRDLGIEVVAEGVEQAEQAALLRQQGCGLFQGHLFGRAVAAARFEQEIAGLATESAARAGA